MFVEDLETDTELVTIALRRAGYAVHGRRVTTAPEMRSALRDNVWDVVISDYSLPEFDAPAAHVTLQQSGLDIPFLIVSGTITEESAVAALQAGAHDFITKTNLARLAPAIEREMHEAEIRHKSRQATQQIRFQAHLLDTVGQAIIATDLAGTITYWNRFAEVLYGWSASDVVGRNIVDVTPTEATRQQAEETMAQLRAGQSWSGEFMGRRRDGTVFAAYATDTPISTETGELTGIVGISFDNTERKEAEAAVRRSEANYRTLAENSVQGISIFQDQKMVYANPAKCRLFGYSLEEFTAMSAEQIVAMVHPLDHAMATERVQKRLAGEPLSPSVEFRIVRKDTSMAWVQAFNNPIEYNGRARAALHQHRHHRAQTG